MKEKPSEDKILYQLMNYEKNKKFLPQLAHIRYLDMAIVFYYWMQQDEDSQKAALITKEEMTEWGFTLESLETLASRNTPRNQPVFFKPIEEIVHEMLGINVSDGESADNKVPMHILTNHKKIFGAAAILYPQVLWAISHSLEDDLYILPSSIHECIIVPVSVKCSQLELETIVEEVNSTQVPEMEILSDHVYYYQQKEDCLLLCAKK